jgi:hypothetical protein
MTSETRTLYVVTTTKGRVVVKRSIHGMGAVPSVGNVLWVEDFSTKVPDWYEVRSVTLGFPADEECVIQIVVEKIERKPQPLTLNPPSMTPLAEAENIELGVNQIHEFEDGLALVVTSMPRERHEYRGDVSIRLYERDVPTKTDSSFNLYIGQQAKYASSRGSLVWVVTMISHPDAGKVSLSVQSFTYA